MKYAVNYIKNTFYPLEVSEDINLEYGQMVLVKTEKGEEALKVFLVNSAIAQIWEQSKKKPEAMKFLRVLSQRDLQALDDIKKEEVTAFFKCQALVQQHKLNMNLVQCRYTFDKKKITFYYTAPGRVDFRALLKDLTQTFPRVRIDLRHIGVRDETSLLEGSGVCGKPFCCSSFLRKFPAINVKFAKDQGMPVAPGKISGTCGRLLCCLTYEHANYVDGGMKAKTIETYTDDVNIDIRQLEDDRNSSTGNV
jgi:cell fate regulator YaaT (PSP1 superfamily)